MEDKKERLFSICHDQIGFASMKKMGSNGKACSV